jgi:hypothetical protein
MKKIVSLAAMVTVLAVVSSAADAAGRGSAPGQMFTTNGIQQNGPTAGYPGASGYAPGRLNQSGAPAPGGATGPGASVYAPGFLQRH